MPKGDYIFASESVSEGHPDKICDRISDALLDAYLTEDPEARCGIETMATTNRVVLAGEVRSQKPLSHERICDIVRSQVRWIGYEQEGFDWRKLEIEVYLHKQSLDIARGVDAAPGKSEGAGDQGIMFGYACRETSCLMPAPIYYAHRILQNLAEARRSGRISGLGPDAKSQIMLSYHNGYPHGAHAILVSSQHDADLATDAVREMIFEQTRSVLPEGWMCPEKDFYVNPTGRFVTGGPNGDAGLTGRKVIVDTYGGAAPHGGGAFSGKDPTKVDRSAAYAARYLAKNVVAAGFADRCTIQIAYAIGVSEPLSLFVDLHGSDRVDAVKVSGVLNDWIDLSPRGIRKHLKLNRPIYKRTSAYGHVGREPEEDGGFSWEVTDLTEELKRVFA